MLTLPAAVIWNKELPLEEATLKGLSVPDPWTFNETVEEEALTPNTAPLSISLPAVRVLGDVHKASKPLVPLPVKEPAAQEDQATPEAAVELAVKHKPSLPTVCKPKTPEPVPVISPPLATEDALKPRPPDVNPRG